MRLTMVSVAEQVAFHLAKQIIEGQLQPKEHIQEVRLVKEFQVSRSSVREALLIVARWHLIDIYPNRGAVVCSVNMADIQNFFEIWWLLLHKLLLDLYVNTSKEADAVLNSFVSTVEKSESAAVLCQHLVEKLKKLCSLSQNSYLQSMLLELMPALHHYLYFLLDKKKFSICDIQKLICMTHKAWQRGQLERVLLLMKKAV